MKLKEVNDKFKGFGISFGSGVHSFGKNAIKWIFFAIFAVIVSIVCFVLWTLITSIVDKDSLVVKRISAGLVKKGMRKLKKGDRISVKSGEMMIVSCYPNGSVEEFRGGRIALLHPHENLPITCEDIYTHERKR
jgi:hypothetical protein